MVSDFLEQVDPAEANRQEDAALAELRAEAAGAPDQSAVFAAALDGTLTAPSVENEGPPKFDAAGASKQRSMISRCVVFQSALPFVTGVGEGCFGHIFVVATCFVRDAGGANKLMCRRQSTKVNARRQQSKKLRATSKDTQVRPNSSTLASSGPQASVVAASNADMAALLTTSDVSRHALALMLSLNTCSGFSSLT